MTKEKFLQYKKEYTRCYVCGKELKTNNFSYSYIRDDGTGKCKVCDWIDRKGGMPEIDGYSNNQIRRIIEFVIFEESIYMNDLANILDITLAEAIDLIRKIKIGNKKYYVKTNCSFCGKEIDVRISKFLLNKDCYCGTECYWKHKPIVEGQGKDNWQYKRISTHCSNCGKEIDVIPYYYNNKNSFGDSNNFCSQKCYWEFRRNYYVGDKSSAKNREWTDEQREHMKQIALKNSRSSKRFDSKAQLIVNELLDKYNIKYKREEVFKYYAVDNYLYDYNLIIEVMGDYWHCSPLKYNDYGSLINSVQQKDIHMDKAKHTYIKLHYNIEILYLWESDILNNSNLCEDLITYYIKNNGIIENYHSFNWNYIDKNFSLSNNIIIPYQDMDINEYRHLFK